MRKSRLGGGSAASGRRDVVADEGLAKDGDKAALGLLTGISTAGDEFIDVGRSGGGVVAVEVGDVQDISSAAERSAGRADAGLASLERSSKGGGGGKGKDGGDGELHFGELCSVIR